MIAKIIPYLFRVIILLIIGGGAYYLGNKVGYNQAITEVSIESSKLAEQARLKEVQINVLNQKEVASLVRSKQVQAVKMSELQQRLKVLQTKPADKDSSSVCDDTDNAGAVVKLFDRAVNIASLPKNLNQPYFVKETDTIEGYCLQTIDQYNTTAEEFTALIETTLNLDCVVKP